MATNTLLQRFRETGGIGKRDLNTELEIPGRGWTSAIIDVSFAFTCINLLTFLVCLFMSRKTRWTKSDGSRDRSRSIGFWLALVLAALSTTIRVATSVVVNVGTVTTYAYFITFIVEVFLVQIQEPVVVLIVHRSLEKLQSSAKPNSSTRKIRLINNLFLTLLGLTSCFFFASSTLSYAHRITTNRDDDFAQAGFKFAGGITYYSIYLIVLIYTLVITLRQDFRAGPYRRPVILICIIILCLFVQSVFSLTIISWGGIQASAEYIRFIWSYAIIVPILYSVEFIALLLLGLTHTGSAGDIEAERGGDGFAYDITSEHPYPSQDTHQVPDRAIYETSPYHTQTAEMAYQPLSAAHAAPTGTHAAGSPIGQSDDGRTGGFFTRWRGNNSGTVTEVPS